MEYRELGKTGLSVSCLGFGGAEIGQENATQETVTSLLNSSIDEGLNFVDTAAAYLASEQMIGKAIADRRKEFVLLSKCGAVDGFTRSDWSKEGILETIRRSLRLLNTDYLDVSQLHSCDAETLRRGDCIEGLIRAQEKGYTRFVGYSGDAEDALAAVELDFFDTLQTSISVADQQAIDLTVPEAVSREMGVIAKRPIANAVWRHDAKPENSYHHEYWRRIEKLEYDFLRRPLTESIAAALSFTLSVEGVATAIVGTTNPDRWKENANMLADIEFSSADFDSIRNRWSELGDGWKGQI